MTNKLSEIETNIVDKWMQPLIEIANHAGEILLKYYDDDKLKINYKSDSSYVTEADLSSEAYITKMLEKLSPNIPIIAEESISSQTEIPNDFFWLVDPLDGTKGYVNHNGEFTINIALIYKTQPIFGLLYIPLKHEAYIGVQTSDGYTLAEMVSLENNTKTPLQMRQPDPENLTILVSRYDMSYEVTSDILENYHIKDVKMLGSAMKYCELALGKADLHIRIGPTMEWDTAPGHVILNAAQGHIKSLEGNILAYNKPNFINSSFIACHKDLQLN